MKNTTRKKHTTWKGKTVMRAIRVDEELDKRITEICRREDMTFTQIARRGLRDQLNLFETSTK